MIAEIRHDTQANIRVYTDLKILNTLYAYFTFSVPNAWAIRRRTGFQGPILKSFFRVLKSREKGYYGECRIGLLDPVKRCLKASGVIHIQDNTGLLPPNLNVGGFEGLRDYQEKSVELFKKAHSLGFVAATNAGKTQIMAALCHAYRDKRILYICDRTQLVEQTRDAFIELLKEDVGIFYGAKKDLSGRVVCGTSTSLWRSKELFKPSEFGMIFLDECHSIPPNAKRMLSRFSGAHVYGFTGTMPKRCKEPIRRYEIISWVGGLLDLKITNKYMIKKGYSADLDCFIIPVFERPKDPRSRAGDTYAWSMVSNEVRNNKIALAAALTAPNTIVVVNRLSHAENLYKMISDIGVPCAIATGSNSIKERKEILGKLENGDIGVLICTNIFDRGLNMPFVRTVVNAAGGSSSINLLQRVGRGLRKKGAYNRLRLVEFWDGFDAKAKSNSILRLEDLKDDFRLRKLKISP